MTTPCAQDKAGQCICRLMLGEAELLQSGWHCRSSAT